MRPHIKDMTSKDKLKSGLYFLGDFTVLKKYKLLDSPNMKKPNRKN
jgi:hypothetical protein